MPFQAISQPEAPSSLKLCQPEFKRDKLQSDKDDIYLSFDKSARRSRLALIINNLDFVHHDYRCGAEIDEHRMRVLLELLGYVVVTLRNLTSQ
ncbi:caspase-1-like, partial [Engraulis encrasicolus]|uniref:caspase-1-like n=1 Tax=Engraulis encrasicolus TaxID=184585 RepID=UPI002FD373F6